MKKFEDVFALIPGDFVPTVSWKNAEGESHSYCVREVMRIDEETLCLKTSEEFCSQDFEYHVVPESSLTWKFVPDTRPELFPPLHAFVLARQNTHHF
ncbi:MAG: hypothetical protein LBT65_02920 [Synergistaceae bacterium]|jgi:hypothetical protein|nr:hypothetical protein [Synergistaceae bacterium]